MSTRGSDAALAAPICPQCGQTIRVSMNVTTAVAARPQERSNSASLAIGGEPASLVAGEELRRRAPSRVVHRKGPRAVYALGVR
jgi:hypothetical protein